MTDLSPRYPVAIVGVGNMGGAMAARLLEQGWPVHVHDIDETRHPSLVQAGARAHATAAQAAAAAEVLILAVVDAGQSEAALFGPQGAAAALAPGRLVVLCPTLAPQDVEGLARRLQETGLAVLDAPMSGGPARAREGTMSLMLAGSDAVISRHQTLLDTLSTRIFRLGERMGDGARTKLVNNLAAGINLVGAAEVLALAQALGLDLARTQAVIEQSSGQSWIGTDRMRRALAGDYAPRAHMTLLEKDTRLAVQAAQSVGFSGLLGSAARDAFAQASAEGLAELDDAALLLWLSRRPTIRP